MKHCRRKHCAGTANEFLKNVWTFFVKKLVTDYSDLMLLTKDEDLRLWHLLPVTKISGTETKHLLHPISSARIVMPCEYEENEKDITIIRILCKLGIPKLDLQSMYKDDETCKYKYKHVLELISGKHLDLSASLGSYLVNFKHDKLNDLEESDKISLLLYLSTNLDSLQRFNSRELILALRHLPIFPNLNGKWVSLNNSKSYIIPDSIPNTESENWTKFFPGHVFLNSSWCFHSPYSSSLIALLLEYLDCKRLSQVETYCSFIFLKFENISREAK